MLSAALRRRFKTYSEEMETEAVTWVTGVGCIRVAVLRATVSSGVRWRTTYKCGCRRATSTADDSHDEEWNMID